MTINVMTVTEMSKIQTFKTKHAILYNFWIKRDAPGNLRNKNAKIQNAKTDNASLK